jgi:RimJ/RimL family protein N-acetyltransferase
MCVVTAKLRIEQGGTVKKIERYETDRLTARRICWADFEDAQQLHSDALVARTLSADGLPLSEDTTRRMLRRAVVHWRTHGFGLWMFRSRESSDFIGRGGLIRYDALDMGGREEIGLAYAVLSPHWGHGYATEMGDASVRIGFEYLGFDTIGAWTLPGNLASQRVMAKLGFRYERDIVFCGLPHRFFRLERRDYRPSYVYVQDVKGHARR